MSYACPFKRVKTASSVIIEINLHESGKLKVIGQPQGQITEDMGAFSVILRVACGVDRKHY